MPLFVDNDVLIKAAHWGLLDYVPQVAGEQWSATSALTALIYRARKAESRLFKNADVAADLVSRLEQCAPLPDPSVEIITALQGVNNIDAGEIQLLGALAATPGAFLLTGDKRAIAALGDTTLAGIRSQFDGRILCLEQWLWFVHAQLGSAQLGKHLHPFIAQDMAAKCIVGTSGVKSDEDILQGLRSYISDLDVKAPKLLCRGFGLV